MELKLVNGVEQNKLYPDTFEIPSNEEKNNLSVGDCVKIAAISFRNNTERFWVKIEKIEGDVFFGQIDNDLVYADEFGFDYMDILEFGKEHILAIFYD